MDANQFIKHIQAQTGLTYAQIAELLTQKPVKNIQDNLCMQEYAERV